MSDSSQGFDLTKLRPLKWFYFKGTHDMQMWMACTPVGEYSVRQFGQLFKWDCALYSGSRSTDCESVEAGMSAAWEHWKNLVRQIVDPHPMDGTLAPATPADLPANKPE